MLGELWPRHHGPAGLRLCRFRGASIRALIYCALKGFLSGPYEHRPALDEVVQFMAGLAYMTGPPGQPLRAGSSVVDIMGGMFAVIGIQAALRERERTGRGQFVKSALFETTAFLMTQHMAGEAVTGRPPPPMPAREGAWAIYELFADGGRPADLHRHHQRQSLAPVLPAVRARGSARRSALRDQPGSRARARRRSARSSPRSPAGTRCRAHGAVRPDRHPVFTGRHAKRSVRRPAAQRRRAHARHRVS